MNPYFVLKGRKAKCSNTGIHFDPKSGVDDAGRIVGTLWVPIEMVGLGNHVAVNGHLAMSPEEFEALVSCCERHLLGAK